MAMIYLVERTDQAKGYDEYHNWVVVAKTPGQARQLCTEEAADEPREVWLNADVTSLGKAKDPTPRTILGYFNAG